MQFEIISPLVVNLFLRNVCQLFSPAKWTLRSSCLRYWPTFSKFMVWASLNVFWMKSNIEFSISSLNLTWKQNSLWNKISSRLISELKSYSNHISGRLIIVQMNDTLIWASLIKKVNDKVPRKKGFLTCMQPFEE